MQAVIHAPWREDMRFKGLEGVAGTGGSTPRQDCLLILGPPPRSQLHPNYVFTPASGSYHLFLLQRTIQPPYFRSFCAATAHEKL